MRHVVRAAVAALLALAAVLPARAGNITFITDFGFNGRHAYFYVAREKGYYKAEGFDVNFVRGQGSADAIKKVAAGIATLQSMLEFSCRNFGAVNHGAEEWVKGIHHTQGIEGFWSILKRSIRGTHVHVSRKHLAKYLAEFEFRWNLRDDPASMFF